MSVTSRIADYHGVPTLFVNDQPQVGMAYITYFEENNRYQDFADAGYTLFTFATFFGGQTINETSQIKPFSPGIFDVKGKADYSVFDRSVARILAACPQAMIFPRVNMSLPKWWEDEHPDDLNDTGFKDNRRRACFSSKLWRKQSEDFLLQLIDHVEAQPWKDHFVGYQIACGNTEEWFSFDQRGSIGKASRDEFAARGGRSDDAVAYRQFLSQIVAEDIVYLAGVVKKRTNRQLAVGSFYGYTFETPHWMSCHMAVKTILASDDVDFLCSPSSYMNTRSPGQDWPCMTVLDSLLLHGKAYFTESCLRFVKIRYEIPYRFVIPAEPVFHLPHSREYGYDILCGYIRPVKFKQLLGRLKCVKGILSYLTETSFHFIEFRPRIVYPLQGIPYGFGYLV